MMDDVDFTEDEIEEQLQLLGYKNIPKHKLSQFKKDLDELIRHGDLNKLIPQTESASPSPNPPAFTKEKVGPCYFADCGQRFSLHTGDGNYDNWVRAARLDGDGGQLQGRGSDSYVRHSVAPKLPPPRGFPRRLQPEADASETLQTSSSTTADETLQRLTPSADSQTGRCIRRKVLRKHKGQSLVCDESIYTDDSALDLHRTPPTMSKMYAECDDEDKNSLSSSFWSDGEDEDEEEVERMVGEEAVKSAEEALREASASDAEESKVREEGSGGTDGDDEESCSSCDSPGPSLMTSGYGTYRPEEQDVGDCTGDQDSRGHLSELRDDEDGDEDDRRSVCSHFWFEEPGRTFPPSLSPEPGGPGADGGVKSSGEGEFKDDGRADEGGALERFTMGEGIVGGGRVGAGQHERPEEEQELPEAANQSRDESPCEQDIRFIDSTLDSRNAASCLEERLAELRLSAPPDPPAARSWSCGSGTEDTFSDASETSGGGPSRSDGSTRAKPKSFIRPVMNRKTVKKTDPVAKYFQYKRLWDVFKLPGEADRTALRLEMKDRLAYQPPPPRPRRLHLPNTYIVPTEKKRSALRWEIRNILASRGLPSKFSC